MATVSRHRTTSLARDQYPASASASRRGEKLKEERDSGAEGDASGVVWPESDASVEAEGWSGNVRAEVGQREWEREGDGGRGGRGRRDSVDTMESGALGWEWREDGVGRDTGVGRGGDGRRGGRGDESVEGRARYTSNGFDLSPSPSSRSSSRASSVRTYRETSRTSFSPPHSTSTSPPISSPVESTFSTSTTFIDGLSSYAASSHRASTSATSVYSDIDPIRTKRCGVREESEEEKDDDEDVLSTLVSSYTPNIDLTELSTPRQLSSFPVEFDSAPFVCVLLDSSAPPPSSSSTKPRAPPPFRPSSPVVLTLPPPLSPKDDAAPTPSPTRAKFTSALKSFTRKSHEKPGFFSVPISEAGGLPSSTTVAPSYSGGAAGRGGAGRKLAVKQVAVLTSPSSSSSSLTLRLAPQHSSHSSSTSSSSGYSSSTVSQRRPSLLSSSGASIRTTSTSSSSSSSSSSGAVARPAPIAYAGGRAGAMASRKAGRRLIVVDVDVDGGEAGETKRKVERVKEGGGTTVKGLSAGVGGGRGRVGAAAVVGKGGKKTVNA